MDTASNPGSVATATKNGTTTPKITCCVCAIETDWNPLNMCLVCVQSRCDITEGLGKEYTLDYCAECQKYLTPPHYWSAAPFESRELMVICLKKIKEFKIWEY